MEHRLTTFQKHNLPFMIYHNPFGFVNALIKKTCKNEIHVETTQWPLPQGAVVERAGAGSWQLESKMGLPKALISHTSKDGETALMLL